MKRSICFSNVIFVGDEHNKKNFQNDVAFIGSKSYLKILSWIYQLDLMTHQVFLYNRDEVYDGMQTNSRIIALGNNAAAECERQKFKYFKLPHPSGRNRKLNDKAYEKTILKECYKWIRE